MADLSSIVESPQPERLATGFQFTEGPLWHPDGYLLFVDIRQELILKLVPGSEPEVFRSNSGASNGLTLDLQGRLIMCEGGNRQLTRAVIEDGQIVINHRLIVTEDGESKIVPTKSSIKPIAQGWQGKRLNRPNDVVTRSDGSIYFTDPAGRLDASEREIDFCGVYRVSPNGRISAAARELETPNGLAFSPDERTLYVANTRADMYIKAYDVQPDGSLRNGRVFADMTAPEEPDGVPDGMKVDAEGRVYCTGPGGCWVFEPDGARIGIIRLPEIPANCAWGGPDNRTMFFTARTSVYSLRMKTPGTRIPRG
ncbi:MAG: SMP-30/gluconolactonase/LRE family protein [Chloroflexi bacterium]|nr:SMP-30/gluconolactonase/LRE family protein [Chloroflexota bacterium]